MSERVHFGREALAKKLAESSATAKRYRNRWVWWKGKVHAERSRAEAIQRQLDVALAELERIKGAK